MLIITIQTTCGCKMNSCFLVDNYVPYNFSGKTKPLLIL